MKRKGNEETKTERRRGRMTEKQKDVCTGIWIDKQTEEAADTE